MSARIIAQFRLTRFFRSALPERLRPPAALDIDHTSSQVLTTYAGLLLRDLLDRFHGDVALAVGGYNGGVRNPNKVYAEGVERAAQHARSSIERAAVLGGSQAATMLFATGQPK